MEKINYEPVMSTGVLSSSIYDDGNVLVLGASTHLSLIEGSEKKFAALEVKSAKNKDGESLVLTEQACEDGNFAVLAISCLKAKKVYSTEAATSSRRLSGGMSIAEIIALEAGKEYKLTKKTDGWKKPFGWQENDSLVVNNSYRLEPIASQSSQPTQPQSESQSAF